MIKNEEHRICILNYTDKDYEFTMIFQEY